MKFQNSKTQNLFPCQQAENNKILFKSALTGMFTQVSTTRTIYASSQFSMNWRSSEKGASKSKPTAVPLSKVKSQTFGNREGSKRARENAFFSMDSSSDKGKMAGKWEEWQKWSQNGDMTSLAKVSFFRQFLWMYRFLGLAP